MFKEELTPMLHKLFQNKTEEKTLPNLFYEAYSMIPESDKVITRKEPAAQYPLCIWISNPQQNKKYTSSNI